jgi:hypothetical protein
MPIPSSDELRSALNADLTKSGSKGLGVVVNDAVRKTFTYRVDGAILEFAHRQPDSAFWSGVKYYGSGSNSRIRIPRTAVAAEPAKTPVRRARKVAAVAVAS